MIALQQHTLQLSSKYYFTFYTLLSNSTKNFLGKLFVLVTVSKNKNKANYFQLYVYIKVMQHLQFQMKISKIYYSEIKLNKFRLLVKEEYVIYGAQN